MPLDEKVQVLYLNPVGNSADDQLFADMAAAYKYPGSTVHIASLSGKQAPPRMNHLEYRSFEPLIAREILKAARYCGRRGIGALTIGCFYDPALDACREMSGDCVVVGPCQASLQAAAQLANRFSVLIGRWKWEDQMRQAVCAYGYRDALASFEAIDMGAEEFQKDPQRTRERLQAAALDAVTRHRAEAIILGCTMEIGFYQSLQAFLEREAKARVPVIDASIAALKAAENAAILGRIGWRTSRVWGMAPPPEKELKAMEIYQEEIEFGNLLTVE